MDDRKALKLAKQVWRSVPKPLVENDRLSNVGLDLDQIQMRGAFRNFWYMNVFNFRSIVHKQLVPSIDQISRQPTCRVPSRQECDDWWKVKDRELPKEPNLKVCSVAPFVKREKIQFKWINKVPQIKTEKPSPDKQSSEIPKPVKPTPIQNTMELATRPVKTEPEDNYFLDVLLSIPSNLPKNVPDTAFSPPLNVTSTFFVKREPTEFQALQELNNMLSAKGSIFQKETLDCSKTNSKETDLVNKFKKDHNGHIPNAPDVIEEPLPTKHIDVIIISSDDDDDEEGKKPKWVNPEKSMFPVKRTMEGEFRCNKSIKLEESDCQNMLQVGNPGDFKTGVNQPEMLVKDECTKMKSNEPGYYDRTESSYRLRLRMITRKLLRQQGEQTDECLYQLFLRTCGQQNINADLSNVCNPSNELWEQNLRRYYKTMIYRKHGMKEDPNDDLQLHKSFSDFIEHLMLLKKTL